MTTTKELTIEDAIKRVIRETQAKNTLKGWNTYSIQGDGYTFFIGKYSQPYYVIDCKAESGSTLQLLSEDPLSMLPVIEQFIKSATA